MTFGLISSTKHKLRDKMFKRFHYDHSLANSNSCMT